jgi:hypothetical protein
MAYLMMWRSKYSRIFRTIVIGISGAQSYLEEHTYLVAKLTWFPMRWPATPTSVPTDT